MSRVTGDQKGGPASKACRIAFSSEGQTMDSKISSSLARAPYFIIAEGDPENRVVIENPGKDQGPEGGRQAALALVREKVDAVVTGNIGPAAARVLEDAHITVHAGCHGSITEAVHKCLAGKMVATHGASYSGCLETPGTSKANQ